MVNTNVPVTCCIFPANFPKICRKCLCSTNATIIEVCSGNLLKTSVYNLFRRYQNTCTYCRVCSVNFWKLRGISNVKYPTSYRWILYIPNRLWVKIVHYTLYVAWCFTSFVFWDPSTLENILNYFLFYYHSFAAALASQSVWVMNVVQYDAPDTLPIIYDRGLFGIYHDWCESFSSYPRTYDLLHSDHLFDKLRKR